MAWLAISAPWSQVIDRRLVEQRRDRLAHRGVDAVRGSAVLEVEQQHEPGGPFDEGGDRGAAALTEDEVAFSVAGHCSVVDRGGAVGDVDHPGQWLPGGSDCDRPAV